MTKTVQPAPEATHAQSQSTMSSYRNTRSRKNLTGWAFVAPFGIVFVLLLVIPLGYAFWLSLQTSTLIGGTRFTWFANYATAFTDPQFLEGIAFVLLFSVVLIPIQIAFSLFAALLLDGFATRLAKVSRILIFIPYAVPAVIGALMWGFMYSPTFGPGGQLFGLVGQPAPNLLSPDGIIWGLLNIVSWQWVGYFMIIIYAVLQGIDPGIYEAAAIDGANERQIAMRIKIPMVASSLVLIVIFTLIHTLQFFTEPYILKSIASGTISSSFTPNIYAFNLAFQYGQFNYASTIAFALGIIVFVGSYIFLSINRKRSGIL